MFQGVPPNSELIANVVYNSSFGLRVRPHTNESSEIIRASRLATAIAVLNRGLQNLPWGEPMMTEPASAPPATGYSALTEPGNDAAYEECLRVAEEAYSRRFAALNDRLLYFGAQYYHHQLPACQDSHHPNHAAAVTERVHTGPNHTAHPPYHSWRRVRGELVEAFGPMNNFRGDIIYLGLYVSRTDLANAMDRWSQGNAGTELLSAGGGIGRIGRELPHQEREQHRHAPAGGE